MIGHGPHGHPPMTPEMQRAMKAVENQCARDVEAFCPTPEEEDRRLGNLMLPPPRLGAPRDPLLEFMLNPMAPPPMLSDMSFMLDQMMNHALMMANEEPFSIVRIYHLSDDQPRDLTTEKAPERVLDSMVHTLMERSAEKPELVAKKIQEHGNALLEKEQDQDRIRMARRLTEVRPDAVAHPPLPFGCRRNRCIMNAFEQGVVSPACAEAMKGVEDAQRFQQIRRAETVDEADQETQVFLGFTMIYAALAIATIFLLHKRLRRFARRMHSESHRMRLILQAVYSNPAIKVKVEDAVGANIGAVPPLPPHILARMGGPPFPHHLHFALRMVKLVVFAAVLTLVFVDPFLAMPILCILMLARFLHLACCPHEPPQASCSCCCCGLSTEDVQEGNITAKQACCTCCNSTGVCAPSCVDCCGTDPDGACDCCSDGCDCCNPKPAPACTCCCCGAMEGQTYVTAEQACCTCCKGTGVCAPGCDACCGGKSGCDCCMDGCDCCDGKYDVRQPLLGADQIHVSGPCQEREAREPVKAIYQGIPIQIV